jgi:hypothetical protein
LGALPGFPGISTFHVASPAATNDLANLSTFLQAFKTVVSSSVTWHFDNAVDEIDVGTGNILDSFHATAIADQVGTSSDLFSAASGIVIRWNTGGFTTPIPPKHKSMRVRGHTYIVPTSAVAYSSTGLVNSTWLTNMSTAGNALMSALSGRLCVYSRPVYNKTTGALQRAGTAWPVLSCIGVTKPAVLTSRRD